MIQLVMARQPKRDYPLVDLTYWVDYDAMKAEIVTLGATVCPECHGPVLEYVCQCCFLNHSPDKRPDPTEDGDPWEGLLITGAVKYVSTKVAELWEKLPVKGDITSIHLPISPSNEEQFLHFTRARTSEELLDLGAFRVYNRKKIESELVRSTRPLSSLIEMFLRLQ